MRLQWKNDIMSLNYMRDIRICDWYNLLDYAEGMVKIIEHKFSGLLASSYTILTMTNLYAVIKLVKLQCTTGMYN